MFRLHDAFDSERSPAVAIGFIAVGVSVLVAGAFILILSFHNNGQSKKLQGQITHLSDTQNKLSDLHVSGDTTLDGALAVTDINASGDLDVAGDSTLEGDATVQGALTADSITTNTDAQIGGALGVNGKTSLQDSLAVAGSTTLASELHVSGATSLADSLDVTGAATLRSSLDVTGATTVGGALKVSGATTIGDTLDIGGALKVLGATSLAGDLDVGGAINLGSTLDIGGAVSIGANLTVSGDTTLNSLDVSGAAVLQKGLDVSGVATLGDVVVTGATTLESVLVSGDSTFAKTLTVNGTATLSDDVTVMGHTTLSGDLLVFNTLVGATQPEVDLGGNLTVTGATSLEGALDVIGLASFHSGLDVATAATLDTMTVTGATTIEGTLGVGDVATFGSMTVNSTTSLSDLTVNGATVLNGSLTTGLDGSSPDATFGGTLNVTGAGQLNGDLTVDGTAHFSNNFNVDGYTSVQDLTVGNANMVGGLSGNGNIIAYGTYDGQGTLHIVNANIGVANGVYQWYDFTDDGSGHAVGYKNGATAGNCGAGTHVRINNVHAGIILEEDIQTISGSHCISDSAAGGADKYDLAEKYVSSQNLVGGDVVSIDPTNVDQVVKSTGINDKLAIGVVSTDPALVMGYDGDGYPVALSGRVPVKVTNEGGAIAPGDYLTTASTPGYAKRANPGEKTIGQALAAFTGMQGTVSMFVSVGGGNDAIQATAAATQLTSPSFDNLNVSGVTTLTDLTVTGTATINNLTVTGLTNVADITVNGHIIGNDDTRGSITVPVGSKTVHHDFGKAYDKVPVVVASPTSQAVLYTIDPTKTGFDINLPAPAVAGTSFNYLVQQ